MATEDSQDNAAAPDEATTVAADTKVAACTDKVSNIEQADLADKVVVQAVAERLAFFFSDANVRQDYFIRKQLLNEAGEYPHQVTVESLLRFNTIKQHTSSPDVVVLAAKSLNKLQVSEDGKAIGRTDPFTSKLMDENIPVTLYVSNLPIQESDGNVNYEVTTDDVRDLFGSYGPIAIVKLRFRRSDSAEADDDDYDHKKANSNRRRSGSKRRVPLGAALVEFENKDAFEKAAAETLTSKGGEKNETTKKLVLGEKELEVLSLKDYIDSRKKRKEPSSESKGEKREGATEKKEYVPFTLEWKPGCVIQINGLVADTDREALLDAVAKGLEISTDEVKEQKIYMDYSRGQKDGAVRFSEPSDKVAELCKKIASGDVTVAGAKVESAQILEGEEEIKYWTNFIDFKDKQMKQKFTEKNSRKRSRRY